MKTLLAANLLALASLCPAQRVFLGATPTNLTLNLGSALVAPDPIVSNGLLVLVPLNAVQAWAGFHSVPWMDSQFGAGNWRRCTMTAIEWAYISDSACAHAPAPGDAAPQSLLTSFWGYGPYSGEVGTPFSPFPNSTRFPASPASVISGASTLGSGPTIDHWELLTRGFFSSMIWNGCGPSSGVTPTFPGFLLARFSYVFA